MTLKLATLSGFGNQARHRPVRFLLSVLARLQIVTPVLTAEKSAKGRLPASPLRPGGVEQRAREQSVLRPRSPRGGEREGPEGARQHQRRRAGLAAAQSPPQPSPGRRERRRVRAAARASERGGGGPEKAEDRSGGPRSGPRRVRVLLADPGKCGRSSPGQPPGMVAAVVVVPVSRLRASRCRLTGSSAVDVVPQAPKGVSQLSALPGGVSEPRLLPPQPPLLPARGRGRWAGPAVGEGAKRGAPLPHLLTNDSGRCRPSPSSNCIPASGSLVGRLSFSFIFL